MTTAAIKLDLSLDGVGLDDWEPWPIVDGDISDELELLDMVLISIFSDARAADSDEIPNAANGEADRRGWWGAAPDVAGLLATRYPGGAITVDGATLWIVLPNIATSTEEMGV